MARSAPQPTQGVPTWCWGASTKGVLADPQRQCDASQNGRGGMFFVLEDADLTHGLGALIAGDTALATSPGALGRGRAAVPARRAGRRGAPAAQASDGRLPAYKRGDARARPDPRPTGITRPSHGWPDRSGLARHGRRGRFVGSGVAGGFGQRSRISQERYEHLGGLFGHHLVPRMLEPDEVLLRGAQLLEPIVRHLRTHRSIVSPFQQDDGTVQTIDMAKVEPQNGAEQIRLRVAVSVIDAGGFGVGVVGR